MLLARTGYHYRYRVGTVPSVDIRYCIYLLKMTNFLPSCREKLREAQGSNSTTTAAEVQEAEDFRRKEMEQRRLMDDVNRKRQARKLAEQERRAKEEQERRREVEAARIRERIERPLAANQSPAGSGKEKLKDAEEETTAKSEGESSDFWMALLRKILR